MRRLRETRPEAWQSMHWFYRRLVRPSISITVLRGQHGVRDPKLEQALDSVRRLERQQLMAIAAAFLCIALVLIGAKLWGWVWD